MVQRVSNLSRCVSVGGLGAQVKSVGKGSSAHRNQANTAASIASSVSPRTNNTRAHKPLCTHKTRHRPTPHTHSITRCTSSSVSGWPSCCSTSESSHKSRAPSPFSSAAANTALCDLNDGWGDGDECLCGRVCEWQEDREHRHHSRQQRQTQPCSVGMVHVVWRCVSHLGRSV